MDSVARVRRFDSIQGLLSEAWDFLAAREAEHNLLLGIVGTLRDHPEVYPLRPYLATVRGGAGIECVALRTPPFNLLLSETDPIESVDAIARDLHELGADLPGVNGPVEAAARFVEMWTDLTGCRALLDMRERVFQLRRLIPPLTQPPGSWRVAGPGDEAILAAWLAAFQRESLPNEPPIDALAEFVERWIHRVGRTMYLWEADGVVVSMVGVGGHTPHGARVGPVYTRPELRGRGYATALTAAATKSELDAGASFCFLFTDLANPTSNHIYQTIGYEPVRDFEAYRFIRL